MTVSSSEELDFYPTPESRNLLTAAKRLRLEAARLGVVVSNHISYNRLLKNLDALEESLNIHFKELYEMERDLMAVTSRRLTEKQRRLLRWLAESYREEAVYTALIEMISEEMGMPKSTVRWNMRKLREAELIRAGDRLNKGVPVRLTEKGRMLAEFVRAAV